MPTDHQILAPRQFTVSAELDAGIDVVFARLSTAEGMKAWVPMCRGVRFEHPTGRLAVGSMRYVALAGVVTAVERIVHVDAPQRLHYTLISAGIRIDRLVKHYEGVNELRALDGDRCRLDWSIHFACEGAMRPFEGLVCAMLRAVIGNMVNGICRELGGRRVA